jgi:hypothetical protein
MLDILKKVLSHRMHASKRNILTLSKVLNSHAYTVLLLPFDRARQRSKDSEHACNSV